jgi:hypothetical protein
MTEQELQEIEARVEEHNDSEEFFDHACEDIPALVAEVRRLREGLEFYAEKANWRTTSEGFAAQYDRESPAAVKDGGIRARLALMSQLDAPNG